MTEPTDQDRRNFAARSIISARMQAEYEACQVLAEQAFGPGWKPI